jgi:hypothetical protein
MLSAILEVIFEIVLVFVFQTIGEILSEIGLNVFEIDPLISETVTLVDVPAALERLASRGTWGKIVCVL